MTPPALAEPIAVGSVMSLAVTVSSMPGRSTSLSATGASSVKELAKD